MARNKKNLWIYFFSIFILIGSFYLTYNYFYNSSSSQKNMKPKIQNFADIRLNVENQKSNTKDKNVPVIATEMKITPKTNVIYKYYYTLQDKIIEKQELAPDFLLNMKQDDFEKVFPEWKVELFSTKKVIVSKIINKKDPFYYKVGVYNGYVAVFYETPLEGNKLKQITETPISAFPQEEQLKLKEGIIVHGEEELYKLLEDYNS